MEGKEFKIVSKQSDFVEQPMVYGLADSATGEIRYVGETINFKQRIKAHRCLSAKTAVSGWLRELKEHGRDFVGVELAYMIPGVRGNGLMCLEAEIVFQLHGQGHRLLNICRAPYECVDMGLRYQDRATNNKSPRCCQYPGCDIRVRYPVKYCLPHSRLFDCFGHLREDKPCES